MSDIGEPACPEPPRVALRRTDGELILLWTLPVAVIIWIGAFFLFPGFNPPMSPTMSAEQVAAFYRDPAHLPRDPVQHDRVQLVRRVPRPDPGADRDADPQDGASHADLLLRDAGLRGRRSDVVSRRQRLLAAGRLPPGTESGADPAAQRFRLDDLHHPGSVSDRAERDPRAGDLFRRSAATGLQPLGGALQPSRRRRAGARCLRRRVIDRPAGVGRRSCRSG